MASPALRRPLATALSSAPTGSAAGGGARSSAMSSSSATPGTKRDSQTLTLPDGRTLGFAEYGHPDGHPVLFFHGFPSSRLGAYGADKMARRNNLRVLSLDRPGFGLSTFQPGRRILDWPADVQAFAEQMRIPRFGIMGASGGGPYALACAHALPQDMLTGVGILEGAGPFDGSADEHIPFRSRCLAVAAERFPGVLRLVLAGVVGALRWAAQMGFFNRSLEQWLASEEKKYKEERAAAKAKKAREAEAARYSSEEDTVVVSSAASAVTSSFASIDDTSVRRSVPGDAAKEKKQSEAAAEEDEDADKKPLAEKRADIINVLLDPFQQGVKGMVQESQLLSQDWGFKFEDVTYDPIYWWHGGKDTNVPLPWILPTVERLPHAVLKVYPGRNHYDLANDLEEMMLAYVPKEDKTTEEAKEAEEGKGKEA